MQKKEILTKVDGQKREFFDFLKEYNVIQLAIGVVVGNAVKDLVSSIANNLILPFISLVTPSGSFREVVIVVRGAEFRVGNLFSSVVDFMIIALVVYIVAQKIFKIELKK